MCGDFFRRRVHIVTHSLVGQDISHVNHRLCNLVSRQIAKLGIMCNGKFRGKDYLVVIGASVIDPCEPLVNRTDKSGSSPRAGTTLGLGCSIGIVKEVDGSVTLYKLNEALNDKKVWWKCPVGHDYQATILHRSSGTKCPICNFGRQTSFAEQAIFFYVKKIYPDAINRYKASFLNKMELDIFIPSINLAIEYDGEAWHKENSKIREQEKYKICQSNGIKLIRIREKMPNNPFVIADECISLEGNMWEHKQLEILIKELMRSLDPHSNFWTRKKPKNIYSTIDINIKRDQFEIQKNISISKNQSLKSLYPHIAKEWHPTLNENLTAFQVTPHSDLKVWWLCPECKNEYSASVSHRVSGTGCPKCGIIKSARKRSKPVQKIDKNTGEILEIFESISDASRKTKISSGNISAVCKNLRQHAGGYIWKYANL